MWNKTVNIKPILQPFRDMDEVSDNESVQCGKALYDLFVAKLPEYDDQERFLDVESQEDLNDALDSLYDWADDNRIWLGLYE